MSPDCLQKAVLKLGGKIVRKNRGEKGTLLNTGRKGRFRNLGKEAVPGRNKSAVQGRKLPKGFPEEGG